MSDERLEATFLAREQYLRTLGEVGSDVWAPLINPSFMGGPSWPALRQSWRDIRNGKKTILVSDGLSDPFDDEPDPNVGFGVEILAETADDLGKDLRATWLFDLVYQVSQNAANHGGFRQVVEQYNVFTMEVVSQHGLVGFENEDGRVGILLGLANPTFPIQAELPGGTLRIIPMKLLTLAELRYVAEHKQKGRERLCDLFAEDGTYHLSSITRKSVV